jgi:aldehyde:ferredoxin oxidoreductase
MGWEMSQEDWMSVNDRRIIQIQRATLLMGGPDIFWDPENDDDNPDRWFDPLPRGSYKWLAPDRDELMEQRKTAYSEMDWDERGIPTSEELNKLRALWFNRLLLGNLEHQW